MQRDGTNPFFTGVLSYITGFVTADVYLKITRKVGNVTDRNGTASIFYIPSTVLHDSFALIKSNYVLLLR